MLITKEPHEELEIKPNNDNESMSLVQRHRANMMDEWNIKVMILSERECLAIHQAIIAQYYTNKRKIKESE